MGQNFVAFSEYLNFKVNISRYFLHIYLLQILVLKTVLKEEYEKIRQKLSASAKILFRSHHFLLSFLDDDD